MRQPLTLEQQLLQLDHVCDAIDDGTPQQADIIANIRSSLYLNLGFIRQAELTPEQESEVREDIAAIGRKIDYMVLKNYKGGNVELNQELKKLSAL